MALKGTLPVIPTPFVDGEIDYPSFKRMIDFFIDDCDGYTINGSTGESPSMTMQERMTLLEFAMQNTPPGKTVIAGITHTDARSAIELARHAASVGVEGCLIPSPYYFSNTRQGVYDFMKLLNDEGGVDLVFYDNPYSTKTFWSNQDLAEIGRLPRIKAIKITDHAIEKIAWLKANTDLSVLCGDDVVLYRSLLLGADGCIVIAPCVFPQAYRQSWELLQAGDLRESYRVFSAGVLPFVHMFGVGSEIAATKAIYQHLGIFTSDEMRAPLVRCSDTWREQLILSYEVCQSLQSAYKPS